MPPTPLKQYIVLKKGTPTSHAFLAKALWTSVVTAWVGSACWLVVVQWPCIATRRPLCSKKSFSALYGLPDDFYPPELKQRFLYVNLDKQMMFDMGRRRLRPNPQANFIEHCRPDEVNGSGVVDIINFQVRSHKEGEGWWLCFGDKLLQPGDKKRALIYHNEGGGGRPCCGGFSWRSLWPPPPLLCAREPPVMRI